MPLDAVFLTYLAGELRDVLLDTKIDKIHQPARDEVILTMHGRKQNIRLLLSASPARPRAHITKTIVENPAAPPMFCMLLRKQLQGGRFLELRQPSMERILDFSFSCTNEFGDEVTRHLILEAMGRNSNLILLNEDGRIVDCVRRVDLEKCKQRQILPGLFYHVPPQDKLNPLQISLEDLSRLLESVNTPVRPDTFLSAHLMGLSPLICRELLCRYDPNMEDIHALSMSGRYAFAAWLHQMFQAIGTESASPYLLLRNKIPFDFSYMPILQYGPDVESRKQESYSTLLDCFYAQKDADARMKSKTHSITKTITNLRNRTIRKLETQQKELTATADRDRLRIYGELITANLYRIERGQTSLIAENYYDSNLAEIEIPLSPKLSPQQNAAKYFKEYNKAKHAEQFLTEQIEKGRMELQYLESILEELNRAETESDFNEIQQELIRAGYLLETNASRKAKVLPSKPMEFLSSAGFRIRVGRNNTQNDQLTMKSALKTDLWFHTKEIHGSHVILSCCDTEPDKSSIIEAAKLAAYYSQAKESQNVPVDYTAVKNIKKPAGAKPGMVTYSHYRTVYVTPDPELTKKLKP